MRESARPGQARPGSKATLRNSVSKTKQNKTKHNTQTKKNFSFELPSDHIKSQRRQCAPEIPVLVKKNQEEVWGSLASQSNQYGEPPSSVRDRVSKTR